MKYHAIRCEVVAVDAESGACPGMARTTLGETYRLDGRTPAPTGICCQAFGAISPMKLAMSLTDRMDWEAENPSGHFDVVCPHGHVTFRLSRAAMPDAG
jgi:uncharacterized repeat protein (TIGR04076 family)